METFIKVKKLSYEYKNNKIINNINFNVKKGEFISLIGKSASGKSTLSKLINGLLKPTIGDIFINDLNTKIIENKEEIIKNVGIVFQNPESQIIGTTVLEDMSFGPINLNKNLNTLDKDIDWALEIVGLKDKKDYQTDMLSGGEIQRLAIAGILVTKPQCIIFDEAFSMIDGYTKENIYKIINKLNKDEKITIIQITHRSDEIFSSDRIILIDNKEILFDGYPEEILLYYKKLIKSGIDLPEITEILLSLKNKGFNLKYDIFNVEKGVNEIKNILCK